MATDDTFHGSATRHVDYFRVAGYRTGIGPTQHGSDGKHGDRKRKNTLSGEDSQGFGVKCLARMLSGEAPQPRDAHQHFWGPDLHWSLSDKAEII